MLRNRAILAPNLARFIDTMASMAAFVKAGIASVTSDTTTSDRSRIEIV
jgi:hypothetical protein